MVLKVMDNLSLASKIKPSEENRSMMTSFFDFEETKGLEVLPNSRRFFIYRM